MPSCSHKCGLAKKDIPLFVGVPVIMNHRVVFYPRLYASAGISYGLASVSVCLSVCLTSRCSIETDGRIELVFGK